MNPLSPSLPSLPDILSVSTRHTVSQSSRHPLGGGRLTVLVDPEYSLPEKQRTTDTLPALRGLSDLADMQPIVVIDTREQDPLPIRRFPFIRAALQTGDYSAVGMEHVFAVERKSIADLVGCCMGDNRERFERELHRLRGYRFKRLLIVGSRADIEGGNFRSNIRPQSVLNSIAAWECRYDVPAVFAPTPEAAAALVEGWAWFYSRETVEAVNALYRGIRGATEGGQ